MLILKENRMTNKFIIGIVFLITFWSNIVSAQNGVYADIDKANHGTGDLRGISVSIGYEKFFKKKLAWFSEFGTDITDREDPLNYTLNNRDINGSLRYTTAGVQLNGGIAAFPLKNKNEVKISLGGIFRYQSSSLPYSHETVYPPLLNYPYPLNGFQQEDNMRTFTLGGKLRFGYAYHFQIGFVLGVNGYIQTDTNGDSIYGYGLTIGKRF
ncbi:MAG: hypothetical protein ACK5NK_06725 [Niabella sp.]